MEKPILEVLMERWKTEIIRVGYCHYGSCDDLILGFALGGGASFHEAGQFLAEVGKHKNLIPEKRRV